MTMKTFKAIALATVVALLCSIPMVLSPRWSAHPKAQGYSGAMPNVTATAATGLGITYTAGSITVGGPPAQAITAGTLTATNTMTSCVAPAYTACNFIYWTSGTALLLTTSATTAFTPGNVIVAFCTSTGGNITTCSPSSYNSVVSSATTTVPTGQVNSAGAYWIPPGNCWYGVVTGTLTAPTFGAQPVATGLGLTTVIATAPALPVMQVATTNAAVISVNTITCVINPPSTVGVTGRGVNLVNADFFYGIQQTGGVNATQVYSLASGTMNGALVFSKVVMPAPGAAETPSTVAPVRADAGTLVVNPAGASFNSLVTTAGAFFTQRYQPATPFSLTTDETVYYAAMTFLCNTTQATTINLAGVLVHFTS
jgi:hypothetical protein